MSSPIPSQRASSTAPLSPAAPSRPLSSPVAEPLGENCDPGQSKAGTFLHGIEAAIKDKIEDGSPYRLKDMVAHVNALEIMNGRLVCHYFVSDCVEFYKKQCGRPSDDGLTSATPMARIPLRESDPSSLVESSIGQDESVGSPTQVNL